jgi:hypothetical protein
MGERGVMGVGGVRIKVGSGRRGRLALLVSAAAGARAGVGDDEGTMTRRSGPRLFTLRGSCAVSRGRTAVHEDDVYFEERCGSWGYCQSDGAEGHSGGTHFVSRSVHRGYPMVMVVYHAMDNSELNEREQSRSSSRFSMTGELDCTHVPKDIFLPVRRCMRNFRVGDHGSSDSRLLWLFSRKCMALSSFRCQGP